VELSLNAGAITSSKPCVTSEIATPLSWIPPVEVNVTILFAVAEDIGCNAVSAFPKDAI
jgi:hypothetical protein